MSTDGDDKSRLERLLEIGVYAPIGFLVTRSRTVPDLAQAGRRQIAFARSLGRAALQSFARGIRRDEPGAATATHSVPKRLDSPAPAALAPTEDIEDTAPTEDIEDTAPTEDGAGGSGEIPDYDDLTARQIIELLQTGDARRARWVHDQETATKGRVTVLRAAAKALE